MRRLLTIFTLLGVLTAFPAAAMAVGPGPTTCPRGLVSEHLGATPAAVKELAEATRPLKRNGMVLLPYAVREPEEKRPTTYDYVWGGENTYNHLTSFMLCGVKDSHATTSVKVWLELALVAILFFAIGVAAGSDFQAGRQSVR